MGPCRSFAAQVKAVVRGSQSTYLNLRIVIASFALPGIVPASLPPVNQEAADSISGAGIEEF
jgi:hypothetical protein